MTMVKSREEELLRKVYVGDLKLIKDMLTYICSGYKRDGLAQVCIGSVK